MIMIKVYHHSALKHIQFWTQKICEINFLLVHLSVKNCFRVILLKFLRREVFHSVEI